MTDERLTINRVLDGDADQSLAGAVIEYMIIFNVPFFLEYFRNAFANARIFPVRFINPSNSIKIRLITGYSIQDDHQEAFLSPGIFPSRANCRSINRDIRNFR